MKVNPIVFTIFLFIFLTFGTEENINASYFHRELSLEEKYQNVPEDVKNVLLGKKVKTMITTKRNKSTAILFEDGCIYAWGNPNYGGFIPNDIPSKSVKTIVATDYAFAIVGNNGRVYAWGSPQFGGRIPMKIESKILHQNIQTIVANDFAFAIITEDGSALSWGHETYGGKIPTKIQSQLKNVVAIVPKFVETSSSLFKKWSLGDEPENYTGFSAKLENGSIFSWGLGPHFDDKKVSHVTAVEDEDSENLKK